MLPLSSVFVSASQKERNITDSLEKAKEILKRCKAKGRSAADSQYRDFKLRSAVEKATIQYPANHRRGQDGLRS
jgi:hypothetical protein